MFKVFFKNFRRPSLAFSAIEMVIYVAILAVISVLTVNSILITVKSFNQYRLSHFINSASQTVMERMVREIRLAGNIDDTASIFDAHPGRLKLNTIDPDTETPTTIEFFASSTSVMIKKGNADPVPLTPNNVLLMNLVFRKISTPAAKGVKIEMELKGERGTSFKIEKFFGSAVLRKFY